MRLGTLFLIAILIAVGYFVTAPWWTFRSMRDAARNNDQPALARVVDYDSVRQGLADQLAGRPPPPPAPSVWSDPMGAVKRLFTPAPPPAPASDTDRLVSSRSIAAFADGRRASAGPATAGHEPFPMIAFWGPDRCRISVADPDDKTRKTEFVFERKGVYSWKLERIVLPTRRAPSPATTPAPAKAA
jgi:hypothetical protein